MKLPSSLITAAGLVCLAASAFAVPLNAGQDGVSLDAGNMGKYTLAYPTLLTAGEAKTYKPIEKSVTAEKVVLKYEGGAQVTLNIKGEDTIEMDLASFPAEIEKVRTEMFIDAGFSEGGTWSLDGGKATAFPKDKPAKPQVLQANGKRLLVTNFQGKTITLITPEYTYHQLQDNREWGWKIFQWVGFTPYDKGNPHLTFRLAQGAVDGGAKKVLLVDKLGQDYAISFPDKAKDESELKTDIASETKWNATLKPPATDLYGGQPGSDKKYGLKKTGYFHVQKIKKQWLMVDPLGNAVFHLGICGFQPGDDYTYIKGREDIYEWIPPYDGEFRTAFHKEPYWSHDTLSYYVANQIRKFGKPFDLEDWTARQITRVRHWGFNSTGAFSGITAAHKTASFPYMQHLPLGPWDLGGQIPGINGMFDPFDPQTTTKMETLMIKSVAPAANDPLLIGYFLANEQAFEDIPRVIPSLKENQPAKVRLVTMLEQKYKTIGAFNTAWGMKAADFNELKGTGLPVATREASADMQQFTELFIESYYKSICDTYRKYDKNHMLIGNRWQPGTSNSEALCRIAGKYMDVISVNYYTYGLDKDFLNRIYKWTGEKPMVLSEFYWSSPAESGMPGGKEVKSQKERGLAYRNYVEQAGALGYVVGIEWFIMVDQARTGRFFEQYTGEKANTGLVSVTDRPYRDCIEEMVKANYGIYDVIAGLRKPFAWDNPLFSSTGDATRTVKIPRVDKPAALDGSRVGWPGVPPELIPASRLVEGADARGLEGVFRLCWDDENLYLMAEVTDPTPMMNTHKAGDVWAGDGLELFIGGEKPDQAGPLLFSDRQVLLSAGTVDGAPQFYYGHAPAQFPCKLKVIPAVNGKGYTLTAAIPFKALDIKPVEGMQLRFDLGIDNSVDGNSRIAQLMWNGGARNSGDRTHWGRAVLIK